MPQIFLFPYSLTGGISPRSNRFDNITLFDNRAVSAKYSQLPNGKYQVHHRTGAKRYRTDGNGQELIIRFTI